MIFGPPSNFAEKGTDAIGRYRKDFVGDGVTTSFKTGTIPRYRYVRISNYGAPTSLPLLGKYNGQAQASWTLTDIDKWDIAVQAGTIVIDDVGFEQEGAISIAVAASPIPSFRIETDVEPFPDVSVPVQVPLPVDITKVGPSQLLLGNAQMATSLPVTIAGDQIVPGNLVSVGGTNVTLGQKAAAAAIPVVLDSDLDRGQKAMAASIPVTLASDQGTAKGTQAAAGIGTQDLKDAGRVAFGATANGVAGVVAEAMLSLIPVRAGVAGAGVTSLPVTAGKRLRLTAMIVSYILGAAAANASRFYLRTNPAGAVVIGSPLLLPIELIAPAAVIGLGAAVVIPLPDGFEFSGTDQVGISHIANATTNVEWVSLIGFEY